MNFDLTDEQRMLQETVAQYVENECPMARLREIFDGDEGHDPVLWKGLAELGVVGLAIGDQYGGAGLEMLDLAVVAEKLGHAAFPGPFFNHALGALAIELAGSDEQKEAWLPRFREGKISAFALTEPNVGSDPAQMATEAVLTEYGQHYIINGDKLWCTNGPIADILVVMAKTAPIMRGDKEIKQITALIVEIV